MMPRRVLLVDDDRALRGLVRATLPEEWFEVAEAQSGRDALAKAEEHRPDLVVLDWRMPEGSGAEVLARLKADDPTIRVVVLTAEKEPGEREAADRLGADAFLTKPFSPLRLLDVLERLVDGTLPDR